MAGGARRVRECACRAAVEIEEVEVRQAVAGAVAAGGRGYLVGGPEERGELGLLAGRDVQAAVLVVAHRQTHERLVAHGQQAALERRHLRARTSCV